MANRVISSTGSLTGYSAAVSIDAANDYLLVQQSGTYKKLNRNILLGVTGTPADISTAQNLTNKVLDNTNTVTLKDTLFTLQDDGDTTKQAKFQLSGITTGTTRTYTLPNANSTLMDLGSSQTVTGVKTLTAPIISGGSIDNSTITVDSIAEHTASNGVSISGLNIKSGKLNTNNSVVTANVTDGAITPAKLVAGTGAGWALSSWTPILTGISLGNGTLNCKYIQMGKVGMCRFDLVFGTSTTTSGDLQFTFPLTTVTYPGTVGVHVLGNGRVYDSSAGVVYNIDVAWRTTTTGQLRFIGTAGTYAIEFINTGTAPITFAVGDEISAVFWIEAA